MLERLECVCAQVLYLHLINTAFNYIRKTHTFASSKSDPIDIAIQRNVSRLSASLFVFGLCSRPTADLASNTFGIMNVCPSALPIEPQSICAYRGQPCRPANRLR